MSEKAICFVDPPTESESLIGVVLAAEGDQMKNEMELCSSRCLSEWYIDDVPPEGMTGLLVWEGECVNAKHVHPDWEPHFHGNWRRPTARELWGLTSRPSNTSQGDDAE